jgi:hypothetical protein
MVLAMAPPSRFRKGKAARIIRHELRHALGEEHEDMTEEDLWSTGKEPAWAKDKKVRYRGKGKSIRKGLS